MIFMPKTPRGSIRRRAYDPFQHEVQKRLLDRAFAEMDRLAIPLGQQYGWLLDNCPDAVPPPIDGGGGETLYIAFNGASPTTAGQVKMPVTNAINTLVQVATPSTCSIDVIEWGISFDASAAAVPVLVELLQTDVAASAGTSLTPTLWSDPNQQASLCVGGTGSTMFNDGAITEGTITATRMFDCQLVPPTGAYVKQFPLGREPKVPVSKFLRIRTTAPAAVNAICYIIWRE